MLQSNHCKNRNRQTWLRIICLVCIALWVSGCATATYKIVNEQGVVRQQMEGNAPGGEVATMIVYYGPDVPPAIDSKVNSENFVKATARLSRDAIRIALDAWIK